MVGGGYLTIWPSCSCKSLWGKTIGRKGGVESAARGLCITIYPSRLGPTKINGPITIRIQVALLKFLEEAL